MSLTDSCVGLRHRGSTGANNPENQDVKELQSEEAVSRNFQIIDKILVPSVYESVYMFCIICTKFTDA